MQLKSECLNRRGMRFAAWACCLCLALAVPMGAQAQDAQLPDGKSGASISIFQLKDFTASLLGSSGPPVPARKPKFKRRFTAIDSLLRKYDEFESAALLPGSEADMYRGVFSAQENGDFKTANKALEKLEDPRLLGHVLFQRYMHANYKTSFDELRRWLESFGDHPGADRIYRLANSRRPKGNDAHLRKPLKAKGIIHTYEPSSRTGKRYESSRQRGNEQVRLINALNRDIYAFLRKGHPAKAEQAFERSHSILDQVEADLLRGEIAASYLYEGDAEKAGVLAKQSMTRSALHVPKAAWVAGLSAWMDKDYTQAARAFEIVARSPYASGWTLTAGAYWAARAHMKQGNRKAGALWLKRAAAEPRTFYGLVATRALGRMFEFNWDIPAFTEVSLDTLGAIPSGNRALALVIIGLSELAEAELIGVRPENDAQRTALLAYANYANLPGLALRVASEAGQDEIYDSALYPTGSWELDEGFKIDPALVHAIMRQESRFDPRAKSASGAEGLMQLMPATAKSVSDKDEKKLNNPETNLKLGQRYIEGLLESDVVQDNLLYLLIAYNGGPGNLAKWKKLWPDAKDPLLFIELIPSSETRAYVERVLSNYWIYRLREDQDTPTLDALAAGRLATYDSNAL